MTIYKVLFPIWIILGIACGFLMYRQKKKEKVLRQVEIKKAHRNYLYPFYLIFIKIPPLRKQFEKIKKRMLLVYPADMVEVNNKVTKDMTMSLGITILVILLVFLVSAGDIYFICMGIVVSIILYTHIINMQYESSDEKLLKQFKTFLTDVRSHYYSSGRKPDDAVYDSIDEAPYEMSLHASKIYNILTNVDMQKEVDKYVNVAPNRFILSFVAIVTSIMEYGDKILENGKSMFVTNLGFLKDEVHTELEKIKMNKELFSGRTLIAILPIFPIKLVQWWAKTFMPEIKDYYTGVYGFTCEVLIFLLVIVCYTLVMNLKDRGQKTIKEHWFLQKASKLPIISPILTKEVNRNFSKSQKINDKLKLTGEHMGYKQFLLKRYLYAICFFFGFQMVMISSQWQEKNNILSDYSAAFETSFVTDEVIREEMIAVTKTYVQSIENFEEAYDTEVLTNEILENTSIKKPLLAELVVSEITNKINEYNNIYYRWYYLIIGIGLMVLGYYVPLFILDYKVKSMRMGMEDEVNQYQTIVMILMHVDNMSIKIMLEWIEKFSYCFKESINTCINELPTNEEVALKKLRDSETFEPFKRFVNNMLCVNEQGLVAAFDEIVSERANSLEERKSDNQIITRKKANNATIICLIPLAFEVVTYIIYPLLVYSQTGMSAMGF